MKLSFSLLMKNYYAASDGKDECDLIEMPPNLYVAFKVWVHDWYRDRGMGPRGDKGLLFEGAQILCDPAMNEGEIRFVNSAKPSLNRTITNITIE